MDNQRCAGSFRDPDGFVFRRGEMVLRQINAGHRASFELFQSSGLQDTLLARKLLLPFTDTSEPPLDAQPAWKVIRPVLLPFVSYPYEWCFSQLKDAALAVLDIQDLAFAHGMALKDASNYNMQFYNGTACLIDHCSFEPYERTPWTAYRQFCRHFLAPLALMAYRHPQLGQLLKTSVDGIPLQLAARLLPLRARCRPGLFLHVMLHAQQEEAYNRPSARPSSGRRPAMSPAAIRGLIDSLRSCISKLSCPRAKTLWSDYARQPPSYDSTALDRKKQCVDEWIGALNPSRVWDLGANTGLFSRMASRRGIFTLSTDMDHECVELNYREANSSNDPHILPLLMDINNPSPALGWDLSERLSIIDRGPADMVLALALIHHLCIGNNVPLDALASFFRRVCRTLVIEFIPKYDPLARQLLTVRKDIFSDYTQERFEQAFAAYFSIDSRQALPGSQRTLYLMKNKG